MQIDRQIREGVIKSLPEAEGIRNHELREKVYDAWALSLQKNGFKRIEEMELSGTPGRLVAKKGTQTDHLRGVTRLARLMAAEMTESFEEIEIDMDEVIAGGLCHDLGKPFEYNTENRKRWSARPRTVGFPSIRHTQYGTHIALTIGLPESIAHIAGAHSMEGQFLERSLVGEIIHDADEIFWKILVKAGYASP